MKHTESPDSEDIVTTRAVSKRRRFDESGQPAKQIARHESRESPICLPSTSAKEPVQLQINRYGPKGTRVNKRPSNSELDSIAEEYAEKVKSGLKALSCFQAKEEDKSFQGCKLKSGKTRKSCKRSREETPISEQGELIAQYRYRATAGNVAEDELEKLLERYKSSLEAEKWTAWVYEHYERYRRRRIDESETKDQDQERREMFCEVLTGVMSGLRPSWGVCAQLIPNALRGTYSLTQQVTYYSADDNSEKIQGIKGLQA